MILEAFLCPVCNSVNLQGDDSSADVWRSISMLRVETECLDCGSTWADEYHLTRRIGLKDNREED